MPSIAAETVQAFHTLGKPVPPEDPVRYDFEEWGAGPAEAVGPPQRQLPARLGSLGELYASFDEIMERGMGPFTPGYISTGRSTNPHAQEGPDTAYTPSGYVPGFHLQADQWSSQPLPLRAGLPLQSQPRGDPPLSRGMPPQDKPPNHRFNREAEEQSPFKRRLAVALALGVTILGAVSVTLGFYLRMRGR